MENHRYAGKPWWQMPLSGGAPRRSWAFELGDGKGLHGGTCQRIDCSNGEAYWFNETNGKYYCTACAKTFNDVARRHNQPPLCQLHPKPMEFATGLPG